MKQNITVENFINEHKKLRPDNFTREGLIALFNFYAEYDEEIELDVIRDCVYFSEYKNLKEFYIDYDKADYQNIEDITDRTTLIKIENSEGFTIEDF